MQTEYKQLRKQTLIAPRPAYYRSMQSMPSSINQAFRKKDKKDDFKNTMKIETCQNSISTNTNTKFTTCRNSAQKIKNQLLQNKPVQKVVKTENNIPFNRKKPQFTFKKYFNKLINQDDLKNMLRIVMKQIEGMLKDINRFVNQIEDENARRYAQQLYHFQITFSDINKKVKQVEKGIDHIGVKQILKNILQNEVKINSSTDTKEKSQKQNLFNNQISIIASINQKQNSQSNIKRKNSTFFDNNNNAKTNIIEYALRQLCHQSQNDLSTKNQSQKNSII